MTSPEWAAAGRRRIFRTGPDPGYNPVARLRRPRRRRTTEACSTRCTPSSAPSSRSSGSSSARTGWSSGCWSACSPRATCCSRACPAWPRRWPSRRFAKVVGGTFARIQFTPDLVPTDIVGTRIYRQGREEFDIELGPVFANFVLADEINRAPAKVQSALLEVMAERQVSIGGKTFPLPDPFLVMATQNPIEHEGVYPLPEAQRDRFLFKIIVDYPTPEEEREIVYRMGVKPPEPKQVLAPGDLLRLQDVAANSVRAPRAGRLRRAASSSPPARPAELGLPDVAGVDRLRRLAARLARHHRRGPGAGAGARPRLRAPAGRRRRHSGRAAAPAGADLRRARRRDLRRRPSSTGCCRRCRCRR